MPANNKLDNSNLNYSFKNLTLRYRQYYTYIEPVISDPLVRSYFSLVASLMLITFLLIFALSPTINVVLGLQKQIADQKKTIEVLETKIAALSQAQNVYSQIEPSIPLLNQALPDNPAPQIIISDIHKVVASSNVNLTTFQIQQAPLSKDISLTPLSIGVPGVKLSVSIIGSKENVRKFIGDLEKQLRYIKVDSFTLVPDEKNSGYSADISAVAYFYHL